MKTYDTIVIGGGQAGLAASYSLLQAGLDHVVLEAADSPAGSWPSYYDSLRLFSPRRYSALPGLRFPGEAGGYPVRDEVIAYLNRYAAYFRLPILTGRRVERVEKADLFRITTSGGEVFGARSVVSATGGFNTPFIPTLPGAERFAGRILHSAAYKEPDAFRGRRGVVVGAGNSAVQIAVELAAVADVTLATREPVRFIPQCILGLDLHFWFKWLRVDRTRIFRDQGTPVLDGGFYARALKQGRPRSRRMFAAFTETGVVWSDGESEPVDAVIFSTGFRPTTAHLAGTDALDRHGMPRHHNGISVTVPGLYYLGLPMQRNFASATLRGVGPDSRVIVSHLTKFISAGSPQPTELSP